MTRKGKYHFILVLSGFSSATEKIEDALFEAGCDDALLYVKDKIPFLEFDREARNFQEAVVSAVRSVETAAIGATVVRVEPGDPVNAAEAARRLEVSREYIRLLAKHIRGTTNFPAPLAGVSAKSMIWSWAEIVRSMAAQKKIKDPEIVEIAETTRDVNTALDLRCDKGKLRKWKDILEDLEVAKK